MFNLGAIDPGIAATVLTAVAALVAAYHIAVRTGTFLRPALRIRVGFHTERRGYRKPLALLIGIPRTAEYDYFVVPVPVIVDGGGQSVRDVSVQVSHPQGRDASRLPQLQDGYKPMAPAGCHRRTLQVGTHTLVDYEIPLLRRNQPLGLAELFVYERGEIASTIPTPETAHFEEISVRVRADNHPGLEQCFLIGAVWSDSMQELQRLSTAAALGARLKRALPVFRMTAPRFVWLPPPLRLWRRRLVLCQISITHAAERIGSCSGLDGSVVFQTMDFLPIHVTPSPRAHDASQDHSV